MTKFYCLLLNPQLEIEWSCEAFSNKFKDLASIHSVFSTESQNILKQVFQGSSQDFSQVFLEVDGKGYPFLAQRNQNKILLTLYKESQKPASTISPELLFAQAKVQEAYQIKTQFLSAMSHEIRTPLNAIMGMTHLLLEEEPRAHQLNHLNTLSFNSEKLLILINDILDYAQIDAGKIHFQQTPISPKQIFQDCVDRYEMKASLKNISLSFQATDLPSKISIDGTRLSQIISNLISNAIKYTLEGEVTLSAKTIHQADVHLLQIDVQDTGVGIPEEYHKTIFDRFAQVHPSQSHFPGGTGLGLSIVKKLVELQKGTIALESIVNTGTTFTVCLPFQLLEGKQEEPTTRSSHLDLIGVHILLVDDLPINILVASRFLKKKGAMITSVENGEEAWNLCQTESFDFILMDLHMPVMDGFDATLNIRKIEHHKTTPIVALTADVMGDIHKKCEDHKMDGYLAKPIRPIELYEKILLSLET